MHFIGTQNIIKGKKVVLSLRDPRGPAYRHSLLLLPDSVNPAATLVLDNWLEKLATMLL